ncbi:DEAD/DEAH box helicase [Pantoea sp. EA-12]|uniref:DEAD/DEAH box helicase n=1 Tax=Pantoea sp. EA-12 TaxID=3043303 RepID=UPI0024B4E479|nr:DEAD/DEAH box helicase [Pantoea sp. EA-12]MDI9222700.1 DEAD/DEAH box helicase [Pantoea sp. EA-12]
MTSDSNLSRQVKSLVGLPSHHMIMLYQLAVMGSLSKTALMETVNKLNQPGPRINQSEIESALQSLQDSDWIEKVESRWQLTPSHENSLQLLLLKQPELMLSVLDQARHMGAKSSNIARTLTWMSCLAGLEFQLSMNLSRWMSGKDFRLKDHPAMKLVADDAGKEAFLLLNKEIQIELLSSALNEASYQFSECDALWQFACEQDETLPGIAGAIALQALWRDERSWLEKYQGEELSVYLVGWLELFADERDLALKHYRALASQMRKLSGKRKLDFPPQKAVMAAITLLSNPDTKALKALQDVGEQARLATQDVAWWMIQGLFEERYRTDPYLRQLKYIEQPLRGMPGLFQSLILFWLGDTPQQQQHRARLQAFVSQLDKRGYRLAAYEIRTLLHLQFNEDAPTPLRGRVSLSQLWQRKSNWEFALEALTQLAPNTSESTSRLAWFITRSHHGVEMVPLEQKRNKQGWTKGRALALKRLRFNTDELDWLLPQDRQACEHIQGVYGHGYYGSERYEVNAEKALPLLAGHPAVFWHDAPDIRIDIEKGEIILELQEKDDRLSLKLSPAFDASDKIVIVNETPTRIVAYPVSEAHQKIAAIIGDTLFMPSSARDQVLKAVSAIAPLLPVQANLPELMAHIPHVDADEKIYAQLLPIGEGLRVQLLVRPIATGAWLGPGRGNEIVNGEQSGQAVQTRRDLAREKNNVQHVIQACPLLAETEQENAEWQLDNVQDALEVLTQLRSVNSTLVECIWPEGERFRIGAKRSMREVKFNITRQGEWFALGGELKLDNGKVIELRELLTLMQQSHGRFIQLSDQEWLALDHQLRQRLQQIALMSGHEGESLTLNMLTLPFIKTLADEAGDLVGDADWQQKLHELETREHYHPKLPSTLKAELRDYQLEGFTWLARLAQWGVGACLADDMGLGKTLQSLALLVERAPAGPQLIVTPTSITHNWLNESATFAPTLQIREYRHNRKLDNLGEFDVVVVSYGMLQQDIDAFASQHWHSVVLDEAQAIKNAQTQRAQAVVSLKADFRLALSGTPVENSLSDLWSLFRFINPGLLGSQKSFNKHFAAPIDQGDKIAASTLKQLIQPFMLRRTKAQVLQELPARTDILHLIPMSDEELHWYEALRQQAVERMEQVGSDVRAIQVLAELTRLRRFCCNPSLVLEGLSLQSSKMAACLDIINELRANNHKALIFSQFVDHLALLRAALEAQQIPYQYLDGSTPVAERNMRVKQFQSGDGDLFLISLKAGGTGLNLTAADYVIHLDPWWNPAVEDQASDRAHRIGQERPVTVYRLVMEGSIEQQIVSLHSQKRQLAEDLLEGSDSVGKLNTEMLLSMLQSQ